jgi:hypothetical protein
MQKNIISDVCGIAVEIVTIKEYCIGSIITGAVKKFPEWWYFTVAVGHTATLT